MMRAIDKQLHTLPAVLVARLIRAIVPLGRAAACARLLTRLVNALAAADTPLSFAELLATARLLCRRMPLAEPLLLQLRAHIQHELSSEGEGSLAGSLLPEQISLALWLFVRHLPQLHQLTPHSPLVHVLPPLIEQLLLLVGDLDSLSSEQVIAPDCFDGF